MTTYYETQGVRVVVNKFESFRTWRDITFVVQGNDRTATSIQGLYRKQTPCEKHGHQWYSPTPQWDMTAYCTVCGEQET